MTASTKKDILQQEVRALIERGDKVQLGDGFDYFSYASPLAGKLGPLPTPRLTPKSSFQFEDLTSNLSSSSESVTESWGEHNETSADGIDSGSFVDDLSPYAFMHRTISKDNTRGEDARKSELFAFFGEKLQQKNRIPFVTDKRSSDLGAVERENDWRGLLPWNPKNYGTLNPTPKMLGENYLNDTKLAVQRRCCGLHERDRGNLEQKLSVDETADDFVAKFCGVLKIESAYESTLSHSNSCL